MDISKKKYLYKYIGLMSFKLEKNNLFKLRQKCFRITKNIISITLRISNLK